jgi:hypothetical protein
VELPLAIAFAIASGVSPDRGLYTAIVAGFIISALGGSRVQIGGPTGAFVVIVYGIVQKFGIDGLIVATMMAGVILVIIGISRLGSVIKFIPHPVVIGFTSGIAVIIFSSEVKDLLGEDGRRAADFFRNGTRSFSMPARSALCDRNIRLTIAVILFGLAVERQFRGVCGVDPRHRDRPLIPSAAGTIGQAAQRRVSGNAASRDAASFRHAGDGVGWSGLHHRDAWRGRVLALGGGVRRHDWKPPSVEHGARCARHRQHRDAALRRHTGNWSDRENGHQRPFRSEYAGRRHGHALTLLVIVLAAGNLAERIPISRSPRSSWWSRTTRAVAHVRAAVPQPAQRVLVLLTTSR